MKNKTFIYRHDSLHQVWNPILYADQCIYTPRAHRTWGWNNPHHSYFQYTSTKHCSSGSPPTQITPYHEEFEAHHRVRPSCQSSCWGRANEYSKLILLGGDINFQTNIIENKDIERMISTLVPVNKFSL